MQLLDAKRLLFSKPSNINTIINGKVRFYYKTPQCIPNIRLQLLLDKQRTAAEVLKRTCAPEAFAQRAGYRAVVPQRSVKFGATLTPSIAQLPFASSSMASRRFLAAISMRHYVPHGPIKSGKLLLSLINSIGHLLRASLRIPVMILTAAIASLAYIEYKLSQLSAPAWVTGSLEKMRGWLEGVRGSEWLHGAASGSDDNESDRTKENSINKAVGSGDGWNGGNSSGSGNDPLSGGNSMPPPKGDYYTSPEPESTELDYEDTPRPPRKPRKTGPDKDAAPNDENVLMELTKKLLEIQTILKSVEIDDQTGSTDRDGRHSNALRLPSIVVIGSQSSGKSSVLEAIVGQEFLPKGNNMVTRRPIELTLVNTPHSEDEYGEFPQLGLDRIDDFRRIQRTLYDLNMSVPDSECVSDKPIELRIYSPHVPDLRLVDLPGYIQVVNRKQPPILRQKIRDLCEGYLKQPNIILAVCAADVDLANSEALKASRRNDPMGVRTIGVITKVDTTEPDTAVHMLTQNDYPLHLGYIGVVCKPVKEKVGRSSHDILLSEAQYFGRHSEFQGPGVQVGVGTLRRKLVRVLEESMRRSLSSLVDAVRSELEETRYQIKVQYNDERISPESYVAESLDALKQRFKAFQQQFGKPQLRAEVQRWLESQVMNVCAELYWSNPGISGLSNHVTRSRAAGWWTDVRTKAGKAASAMTSVISELLAADTTKEHKGPRLSKPHGADNEQFGSNSDSNTGNSRSKGGHTADNEWDEEDDVYWNHQLDRASALLTKSGVGRWTTQMVVDLLMENVTSMVDVEPFMHHPDSRAAVLNFSNAILRSKYHPTVDQVENTIKPFKYEVEIEPHEWKKAQKRSGTLIENEIRLCRQAMLKIRSSTPKKQLQQAIQFVKSAEKRGLDPIAVQTELARRNAEHSVDSDMGAQPKPDSATGTESGSSMLLALDATDGKAGDSSDSLEELGYAHFNPYLLRRAQQALMIQDRLAILHMRKKALSSSTCALLENKRLCPEVFLDVVAEKLAYNVVLFINYELLQDFFFQFPRELDSHLYYGKTLEQTREFASQNPRIGKHLTLLERRQKLELVMTRLQELVRQQVASEQYHGRGRNNGYTSSSSPFGRIIGSSE
ncbi:mitochondrial dynamin GTPase Msp1 [Coemansia spiralis]|uniref:dynamin GTPase n=2 Tax=Coemansia TaxID=4863 RepID=A0A9W8GAZ3_9FUNG|nr:mitochondrial dynamin GTPase Msp1 [Coemansia umbellata]KAJ2624087.1 mitochondrial dynamin GTPase Msp1 [Coemansia sp. RSA 1358]KAJ2679695.1 mitochondrial dynamin GTPase Msp1 [Coemansia spiralis]